MGLKLIYVLFLGMLIFESNLILAQNKIVKVNPDTRAISGSVPFNEPFFVKIEVDSKERLSQVNVEKVKFKKSRARKDSSNTEKFLFRYNYDYEPNRLSFREYKLFKYESENTFHYKDCYKASSLLKRPFMRRPVELDSKTSKTDHCKGREDTLSTIYQLTENSISYSREKDKVFAIISVPQLAPESDYTFSTFSQLTKNEVKTIYQLKDSLSVNNRVWVDSVASDFCKKERTGIIDFEKEKLIKSIDSVYISSVLQQKKGSDLESFREKFNVFRNESFDSFEKQQHNDSFIDQKEGLGVEPFLKRFESFYKEAFSLSEDPPVLFTSSSTRENSFEKTSKYYLTPEFGLFYAFSDRSHVGALTFAGVQINLRPQKRDYPFDKIKHKGIGYYTSFYLGASISGLSFIEEEGRRENFSGSINPMGGIGVRVLSFAKVNYGLVLFRANDSNPVISDTKVKIAHTVGLTFDFNIQKNLPGLFGLIK